MASGDRKAEGGTIDYLWIIMDVSVSSRQGVSAGIFENPQ
jgi:hypothetical protein